MSNPKLKYHEVHFQRNFIDSNYTKERKDARAFSEICPFLGVRKMWEKISGKFIYQG